MTSNPPNETRRSPYIIPFFLGRSGCSHRCVFCHLDMMTGNFPSTLSRDFFNQSVETWLERKKDKNRRAEIAFYGGNFTGMEPSDQERLLEWCYSFVQKGWIDAVRISTRPDDIAENKLFLLKRYGVKMVEIGAQSFVDEVLLCTRRGHDAAAVDRAIGLLKNHGFQTGVHLMVGLPGDDAEGFFYSVARTVDLRPDTVRIHPTLVLKDTILEQEFRMGRYKPMHLADAVAWCAIAWERFSDAGIRVIRIGIHVTTDMLSEGVLIAGPFHPSFGSLVLQTVFLNKAIRLLKNVPPGTKNVTFVLSSRDLSSFQGLKNSNLNLLRRRFPRMHLVVRTDDRQRHGKILLQTDAGNSSTLN